MGFEHRSSSLFLPGGRAANQSLKEPLRRSVQARACLYQFQLDARTPWQNRPGIRSVYEATGLSGDQITPSCRKSYRQLTT